MSSKHLTGAKSEKMEKFIVVYLEKKEYFENRNLSKQTKIFFSPNQDEIPDFTKKTKFYVNKNQAQCYDAVVVKRFGKHFLFR